MLGRLGLDLARENQPDLILLDLHLPDLERRGGARRGCRPTRPRATSRWSSSAPTPTKQQLERLRAGGAKAYLTKPIGVRRPARGRRRVPGSRAAEELSAC